MVLLSWNQDQIVLFGFFHIVIAWFLDKLGQVLRGDPEGIHVDRVLGEAELSFFAPLIL